MPTTATVFAVAVFLAGSLFIANLIAWGIQFLRDRRIAAHARNLARATKGSTPITVITGFLGAGKTTLLNRILASPDLPYRIAVIENEVGAISIDHSLLADNPEAKRLAEDGIFVLRNGCMCCTATGSGSDLERILGRLAALADSSSFDYVVVETSGLADPGPVLRIFLHHEMSKSRFYIDGVITVVDTQAMLRHLRGGLLTNTPEAERQLAYADVVVLNKTDLAPDGDVQALEVELRRMNPTARHFRTTHAAVDLTAILGVRAFDPANAAAVADAKPVAASPRHAHNVTALALASAAPMRAEALRTALTSLVDAMGDRLYRLKGIVALEGSDHPLVVQGVSSHVEASPAAEAWRPHATPSTALVFIGRDLDRNTILSRVREACTQPDAVHFEEEEPVRGHDHSGHDHGHGRRERQRNGRHERMVSPESTRRRRRGSSDRAGDDA